MRLFTKATLIEDIKEICRRGWIPSVKRTIDTRNDGAVGNTLEDALGIEENNLPIPNAQDWELKGQRLHSKALVTLKHIEPSPTGARIVANLLLPKYGWRHRESGRKYPEGEMSFRSTTRATAFTNRGFRILVDREQKKVRFIFDAGRAHIQDAQIAAWLASVEERVGLGPLDPEPYWGFEDLRYQVGEKIKNCFYAVAESKMENGKEFFRYRELHMLSGFSFDAFLQGIELGHVFIDFDARTGHNHGTKIRITQSHWPSLYATAERLIYD